MTGRRPSRVVVVNDRSMPVGGASNLARLSVGLLRRAGIEVVFFCGDDPAGSGLGCEAIGLGEPVLTERARAGAFVSGLYNGEAFRRLSRLIAETDTADTVYHVHGWSKILSPAIFRALRQVRARTVLHAHDYFLACPNGGFVNFPAQSICTLEPMSASCIATQCDKRGRLQKLWRVGRHALRNHFYDLGEPANIVAVHQGMARYMEKAGVKTDRMRVIPNPVQPWSEGSLQPANQDAFFFVGRLEPEKGIFDVAEAARRTGLELHVIGEGSARAVLERDYPGARLHGWMDRPAIADRIRQARAVVIPSRVPEPFSLAALEAAGCGLPVIMPAEALIARDLHDAGAALTFTSGDVDGLADAMHRLARSAMLVRTMAEAARGIAPHLSSTPDGWGDALVEFYREIIAEAAPTDRRTITCLQGRRRATHPSPKGSIYARAEPEHDRMGG